MRNLLHCCLKDTSYASYKFHSTFANYVRQFTIRIFDYNSQDFNENIWSNQTPIQTFFLQNNYKKQIITKVTTTYGTLLDHAYVKNCEVVYSDVYDMYFSDHDLIVLGVKF